MRQANASSTGLSSLRDLTRREFEALGDRPALLLPVGPLRPHGPHLPLDADLAIAERIAYDIADHLNKEGRHRIAVAPPLAFAPAAAAAGLAGAFAAEPDAYAAALAAHLAGYRGMGFAFIMIVAWHVPPEFTIATRKALKGLPPAAVFEPGSVFHCKGIPELDEAVRAEGLDPAYEAFGDFRETSLLLYLDERAVDPGYAALPPVLVNVRAKALAGIRTYAQMGAADGYVGSPARASARAGKKLFKILRNLFQDALVDVLEGGAPPDLPMLAKISLNLG